MWLNWRKNSFQMAYRIRKMRTWRFVPLWATAFACIISVYRLIQNCKMSVQYSVWLRCSGSWDFWCKSCWNSITTVGWFTMPPSTCTQYAGTWCSTVLANRFNTLNLRTSCLTFFLFLKTKCKKAIEYLLWSCMAMENSIPLLSVKYLSWRATLYSAACQCFYDCKYSEDGEVSRIYLVCQ